MTRNDPSKLIGPVEVGPTIGEVGLRLHQTPLRRRVEFFDTAGRLHGLIALAPIIYGVIQTQRGAGLNPTFWWMVVGTTAFALLVRRTPLLRLSPEGISFPQVSPTCYAWNEMCEAHARADGLDILLTSGQRVTISFKKMRSTDVERVKHIIKSQFRVMAARAAVEQQDFMPLSQAA
jgi:hypothetical protein